MSNYIVTPLSPNSQSYIADIGTHGSTHEPYMFLHEGTKTKDSKTIVASIQRVEEDACFEINCNGLQNIEDVGALTTLKRTSLRSADMEVGMTTGKPRELAWRHDGNPGGSAKLLDLMGPDTVLAVYNEDKRFGRGGTLQLNVDWGLDFERMVLISFLSMFEKVSVWGRSYAAKQTYPPLYRGYAPPVDATRYRGPSIIFAGAAGFALGGGAAGGGGCDGGGGGGGC